MQNLYLLLVLRNVVWKLESYLFLWASLQRQGDIHNQMVVFKEKCRLGIGIFGQEESHSTSEVIVQISIGRSYGLLSLESVAKDSSYCSGRPFPNDTFACSQFIVANRGKLGFCAHKLVGVAFVY